MNAANRMGETPLIIAVQQRNMPLIRLLAERGANPDRTDGELIYSGTLGPGVLPSPRGRHGPGLLLAGRPGA